MEKEKIIIDCDPGSDDALAIILALYSGKLDLKAVCSVTGNGALDTTTRNGLNILSLCGREDIPLYRGSAVALDQKQPETVSAFGDDGLGGFAHTIASNKKEEDQNAVATVYKGNIIKNLIMDCQSYTKYRPNETTGGIFVSWRRKEELPTGA